MLLDDEREDFRGERSTSRYVYRLIDYSKSKKYVHTFHVRNCARFINLEKAFDPVWLEGLLFKLMNVGVLGRFFETIRNFLHE